MSPAHAADNGFRGYGATGDLYILRYGKKDANSHDDGTRYVHFTEPEEEPALNEEMIKRLSGPPVRARAIHEQAEQLLKEKESKTSSLH